MKKYFLSALVIFSFQLFSQLPVARDTITVLENNYVLKMPWANGINFVNASQLDVNGDNINDLVLFDKSNSIGNGNFKCFINTGSAGSTKYMANMDAPYFLPKSSNWAVFHDYNGDGKNDLFCSTNGGIKVYKNTSTTYLNFTLEKNILLTNYNPGGNLLIGNLYASNAAVPGFADIDNDGDLDILSFAPQGVFVEYHKNLSKEKYGIPDSLVFERKSDCWGHLSESSCDMDFGLCNSSPPKIIISNGTERPMHAGSCLMCYDNDGDGDKDLVMGDISCNYVQYANNGGSPSSALFNDSTKLYPNFPNKNSTQRIKMNNFPCTYFVDVDKDGKGDLIASPNTVNSENYKSVWLYKNISTNSTSNFQFVKNNFLQDEMIEVGQNSFPVLIDYNADGLKDLLIGNYGYYESSSLRAKLTLYQNVGTATQPKFNLVTRDYANLSNNYFNTIVPSVGDIDGDGDIDMIIGTASGQIHWVKNSAGAGNVCNFSSVITNAFSFTTTSSNAAPQLFDLDGDSKLDILIGTASGKISFYKNIGTSTIPSFSLITNNLGGVDVTVDPLLAGFSFASPFFYKENGNTFLLVGSGNGKIFHYNVPANINSNFTLVNPSVNGIMEGSQSSLFYEDVNNDNKRDLFVGNASGGLSFFSSASAYVGLNTEVNAQQENLLDVFPNPTKDNIQITLNISNFISAKIVVRNLLGENMFERNIIYSNDLLNLESLSSGIYFVEAEILTNKGFRRDVKKIIKCD